MTDFETASITVNDVWVEHPRGRLFVRVWSNSCDATVHCERAPIMLFHDSLGCVDLWRDFPVRLSAATGRNVIAYDRLGFGRSAPRTDKLALDFIADEARTFFSVVRDQLGIEGFIAFGHSVGGGMAVNCAAEFAGECEFLITEAAQAFPEDRVLRGVAVAKEQFKDERELHRLRKYHGDKAKWVLDAWTDTWLDPRFASWSLTDVLPRVTCPVLAIHGTQDEYGTTHHPELIAQLSRGDSKVELMENTYHVPHRERPEEVITLVAEFISPNGEGQCSEVHQKSTRF